MAPNPLTVVGGFLLLFVAPGYFLLQALFPGRRYFGPFHAFALPTLAVVTSTAILVLVGSILGFLPGEGPDGRGWFQGNHTGAPVLEAALGGLSLVLFLVAWARGAFPLLGRPRVYEGFIERGEPEEVTILRDLRLEEERLRKESRRIRKRARESRDPGVKTALTDAAAELDRERRLVSARAREVERRAGERRYAGEPTVVPRPSGTRTRRRG